MRIGLLDLDRTGFPNVALMKLSAWHKAQGDDVTLLRGDRWLLTDADVRQCVRLGRVHVEPAQGRGVAGAWVPKSAARG
jgi:hypothetical protein